MHHGAEQTTHWNTFLTPEVPRVFGLDLPQIHNFSPNITAAILPEAIRQNVDVAPSVELISDGVLRLRQYVKTPIVANATVLVDVPGLGRIARCLIDRDSGRISDPLCLANPAELRTILSKSPSAFASELSELLHQVEPAAELSEMTRTVVEVMEDEAVLADIHGNAIIIAADKNNLTVPARVIGYRSKVQAIQLSLIHI